ncbi:hypothetical protein SLA2020_234900 [Shorea laevis]
MAKAARACNLNSGDQSEDRCMIVVFGCFTAKSKDDSILDKQFRDGDGQLVDGSCIVTGEVTSEFPGLLIKTRAVWRNFLEVNREDPSVRTLDSDVLAIISDDKMRLVLEIKGKAFLANRPNQTSVPKGSKRLRGKQNTSKSNYKNGIGIGVDIRGHPAIVSRYNLPSLQLPMCHRWMSHFYCGNPPTGNF